MAGTWTVTGMVWAASSRAVLSPRPDRLSTERPSESQNGDGAMIRISSRPFGSGASWVAVLTAMVLGVSGVVVAATPASAASGDVLPAGTQYCADSYAGHSSWFGSSSAAWVADINFPGDNGTTLAAPGPGNVSQVTVGYGSGYGNSILWTSEDGSERLHMAHLSSVLNTGTVAAGTPIGILGSTGSSSSPHLHISRSVGGSPAPLVLSGVTISPAIDAPIYGRWPCNGTTYTSAGPASPTPSDGDGDGIPDLDDVCLQAIGPSGTRGCPPEEYDSTSLSDFNGDGRSDVAAFYDYGGPGGHARGFVFTGGPAGLSNGSQQFWDSGAGNFELNRARLVGGYLPPIPKAPSGPPASPPATPASPADPVVTPLPGTGQPGANGADVKRVSVRAKVIRKGSKLRVNADPDQDKIVLSVMRKRESGWRLVVKRPAKRPSNTLVLNLPKGRYRVLAESGGFSAVSSSVRLRR